jgi:predicted RNase H-like nuclease
VRRDLVSGAISAGLFAEAASLFAQRPFPRVLAIDIPIGLTGRGRRLCDEQARQLLGARRSSVFPAPIRAALGAATRVEASRITEAIDGRRVGAQAFAIYRRIRDVDAALRGRRLLRQRVVEAHPEVCFWAWNGRRPMRFPKRLREGLAERRRLVAARFGRDALAQVRSAFPRSRVGDDDIADAFATLWTAERCARREAESLPPRGPCDSCGLLMRIVH